MNSRGRASERDRKTERGERGSCARWMKVDQEMDKLRAGERGDRGDRGRGRGKKGPGPIWPRTRS